MTDPNVRKRDEDGYPASLCTISSQIENIENPRARNGTYKGYAIFTFENPKAARLAVEALNHEEHFRAKIDKDQLPESPAPPKVHSVLRTICIDGIPPYCSRHFFSGLIEQCIAMLLLIPTPLSYD